MNLKNIKNNTLHSEPNIVINNEYISRNLDRVKKYLNNETIEKDYSPSPVS